MVDIYNNLPQHVVDSKNVSSFQSLLTKYARNRCREDDPNWQLTFCARRNAGPLQYEEADMRL